MISLALYSPLKIQKKHFTQNQKGNLPFDNHLAFNKHLSHIIVVPIVSIALPSKPDILTILTTIWVDILTTLQHGTTPKIHIFLNILHNGCSTELKMPPNNLCLVVYSYYLLYFSTVFLRVVLHFKINALAHYLP